jgi:hypothetical protein
MAAFKLSSDMHDALEPLVEQHRASLKAYLPAVLVQYDEGCVPAWDMLAMLFDVMFDLQTENQAQAN